MRRERDEKGNRLFVGSDCLSSQQIAAYFSRLAATRKKHGHLATSIVSWEEVEEFFNEEQIGVEEEDITYKKNAVFSSLQLKHPVTYKSYNLCKLFADGKLATKFSIAELKEICDSFEIEAADFKRRKSKYTEALANVLNSCTCNTI